MSPKKFVLSILAVCMSASVAFAQPPVGHAGNIAAIGDSWEVSVNEMTPDTRNKVNAAMEEIRNRGVSRSIFSDVGASLLTGSVTGLVEVIATEVINLATYRKKEKQKWMQMIINECNYTDSISSIKGIKDFYSQTSSVGPLDPSDLNFDGITIRGMRNGREVVYMSCHIDSTRLNHLWEHSKFYLVLDTMSFYPYQCHLPNLQANGIRYIENDDSGRDNSFSFDERRHLNIGIEFSISSSWINEAVILNRDVELGKFKLNVTIDDHKPVFTYSRRAIERNRRNHIPGADTTYIAIEGDSFVVPRSFMSLSDQARHWGTGEYRIKVKFRESCRFNDDATINDKMKHWHRDYEQLRKMQKRGSEVTEYFRTLWEQKGNTLVKSVVKQGITTGLTSASKPLMPAPARGSASAAKAAAPKAAAPQGGAPSASPAAMPPGSQK